MQFLCPLRVRIYKKNYKIFCMTKERNSNRLGENLHGRATAFIISDRALASGQWDFEMQGSDISQKLLPARHASPTQAPWCSNSGH